MLLQDLDSLFGPTEKPGEAPGAPSRDPSAVNINRVVSAPKNDFRLSGEGRPRTAQKIHAEAQNSTAEAYIDPSEWRPTQKGSTPLRRPENELNRGAGKGNENEGKSNLPVLNQLEELPEEEGYRVFTFAAPRVKSQDHPEKRHGWYKEPTPDAEWKPQWRARRRPAGSDRSEAMRDAARLAAEDDLGISVAAMVENLPRKLNGKVVRGPEYLEALCSCIRHGGTVRDFARALGSAPGLVYDWIYDHPEARAAVDEARREGADAIAEAALIAATRPVVTETTVESYDGQGALLRKDVKRGDDVFARKLAYQGRMDLLKKWAPEKYGDRIELKTTSTIAEKILMARRRIEVPADTEDLEPEEGPER